MIYLIVNHLYIAEGSLFVYAGSRQTVVGLRQEEKLSRWQGAVFRGSTDLGRE